MKNENELDQFFKKGLAEPDLPFNELDWEKMEQKLEPHKSKRAVLLWSTLAAGIAASILLAFFLMFQREESLPVKNQSASKALIAKPSTEMKEQQSNNNQEVLTAQSNAKKKLVDKGPLPLELVALSLTQQTIATTEGKDIKLSVLSDTLPIASSIVETPVTTLTAKKHLSKANTAGRLSFSVIAAPDISSSQANLSPKVSTNLGLLATYSLTNKISLTTGLIYAKKLYDYGGASVSAYGNPGKSMETYANCKVLDIPLNLNYRLYEKGSNAISINTGLSSYIMLNEKYKYVSKDDLGNTKSSVLEIVNQNQHLLGVANISVNFTKKINSQVSIGVQPFLKIPLTGIGYHDSKLQSTGVAFSLNLNMRQK